MDAAAAAAASASTANGTAASPAATSHAARVQQAEVFVKQCLAGHDSSHDWFHIERVRNTTLTLAQREGLTEAECHLAEVAALLHDVADHKYSTDPEADRSRLQTFLEEQLALCPADVGTVMHVIDCMGFNAELARQQAQQAQQAQQGQQGQQQQNGGGESAAGQPGSTPGADRQQLRDRVLAVVQDADRLDAIGAVGIARCLTFGGHFKRVLHDPAVPPRTALTAEQYTDKSAAQQATTLNHFHEKLLKLKGLMRTEAGRQVAEGRHAYMEEFLRQLHAEWRGEV